MILGLARMCFSGNHTPFSVHTTPGMSDMLIYFSSGILLMRGLSWKGSVVASINGVCVCKEMCDVYVCVFRFIYSLQDKLQLSKECFMKVSASFYGCLFHD